MRRACVVGRLLKSLIAEVMLSGEAATGFPATLTNAAARRDLCQKNCPLIAHTSEYERSLANARVLASVVWLWMKVIGKSGKPVTPTCDQREASARSTIRQYPHRSVELRTDIAEDLGVGKSHFRIDCWDDDSDALIWHAQVGI